MHEITGHDINNENENITGFRAFMFN